MVVVVVAVALKSMRVREKRGLRSSVSPSHPRASAKKKVSYLFHASGLFRVTPKLLSCRVNEFGSAHSCVLSPVVSDSVSY